MAGEVPRVGPNQSPLNPRPLLHEGPLSSPYDYERKSGKQGRGKRDREEPEPEEPEQGGEDEDESGHLDNDSFARRRQKGDMNNFLNDKLPWEVEAEERQRRLEEIKQKRGGLGKGTGPLGAKSGPLGRPGTGPLGQKRAPQEKKPEFLPPRALGRQVEGGFDPTAAVNTTFSAYQDLQARQAEKSRQGDEGAEADRPADPLVPLSGSGWDPSAMIEGPPQAPAMPRKGANAPEPPRSTAPRRPGTGPLGPSRPAARSEAPALRKPAGTGPLKPPSAQAPAKPAPPRPEPPAARPEPPAPRPEPQAARPAPAAGPSWIAPAEPAPAQAPPPPPPATPVVEKVVPSAGAFRCQIRVVEAITGQPMAGARLEFEPSEDDMLPVVNVVTDVHGWYRSNDLPDGRYHLSVRAPGFVPQGLPIAIAEGRPLAEIVRMEKP